VTDAPLLLHVFPSFAIGGSQMRLASVANSFGHAFRHAIVSMDGVCEAAARLRGDLAVSFPDIHVRKCDTLRNVRRLTGVLRQLRPDVLVTHNWGSIEWAMANALAGRRHVHIEDGFGPEEQERQLPRRALMRRLVLRRATVVLPSRNLSRIATAIWRLPQRCVRYVPNGIDLARFAPGDADGPPPWPRDRLVVGTVAGLRAEKNVGRLIEAFAAARAGRNARLVIVGDGPEREALGALAERLGVTSDVCFAGHMADPAVAYRHFDVFALSSNTEQTPLSVLEAMGTALPVAATDVGDVAAMVAESNHPFVVTRDAAALGRAIGVLLDDAALRVRLGRDNRARAEAEFDQETMVRAYGHLFGAA
jgi:glycosyltransferase involved in cell wall biosynthesis